MAIAQTSKPIATKELIFLGSTSGSVGFKATAATSNTLYTLPSVDGTNGQVLSTNGSGTMSWTAIASTTPIYSKSFVVTNPTSSCTTAVWRTPNAITVTVIHGVETGGTNVIFNLTECNTSGLSPVVIDGTNITATTSNVNDSGSLSNPGIAANNYIGILIASVSGTVGRLIVTWEYTIP